MIYELTFAGTRESPQLELTKQSAKMDSAHFSRFLTDEVALDTTRGVVPMEAEWLEEFRAVLRVVVVIRFARRPIRVVHIVLCRLPNKLSFLYSVREPNPVIFCIYKNKLHYIIVYLTMLRFVLVFYT